MTRYSASELVQLPRLTAVGAMALGEQLLSAARPLKGKNELSKGVARVLVALTSRHKGLSEVLRDQVEPGARDEASKVGLDRALDGCWGGLDGFLGSFTRLPAHCPQAAEGGALQAAIFPGGLKFLTLPYVLEWSESEIRLQRIRKNDFGPRIEALGGKVFLDALVEAHQAYGRGLGVTAPAASAPAAAPKVRDALDAFGAALRDYVIKVLGSVESDEPRTQAIADQLLGPLSAWSVPPAGRLAGKPAADAPAEELAAPANA